MVFLLSQELFNENASIPAKGVKNLQAVRIPVKMNSHSGGT
jgi:hypothetical protein